MSEENIANIVGELNRRLEDCCESIAANGGRPPKRPLSGDGRRELARRLAVARRLIDRMQEAFAALPDSRVEACKCGAESVPRAEEPHSVPDLQTETGGPVLAEPVRRNARLERRLEAARHPRRPRESRERVVTPLCLRERSWTRAVVEDFVLDRGGVLGGLRFLTAGGMVNPYAIGGAAHRCGVCAIGLGAAMAMDAVEACRERFLAGAREAERRRRLEKRRRYYAAERAKRLRDAERVAAERVPPRNPCPSARELAEAYMRRNDGELDSYLFGRLVLDMEEHFRNRVTRGEGGRICGNSGGARGWLAENCPELARHYHTCMRFRRLAQHRELENPDCECELRANAVRKGAAGRDYGRDLQGRLERTGRMPMLWGTRQENFHTSALIYDKI